MKEAFGNKKQERAAALPRWLRVLGAGAFLYAAERCRRAVGLAAGQRRLSESANGISFGLRHAFRVSPGCRFSDCLSAPGSGRSACVCRRRRLQLCFGTQLRLFDRLWTGGLSYCFLPEANPVENSEKLFGIRTGRLRHPLWDRRQLSLFYAEHLLATQPIYVRNTAGTVAFTDP